MALEGCRAIFRAQIFSNDEVNFDDVDITEVDIVEANINFRAERSAKKCRC